MHAYAAFIVLAVLAASHQLLPVLLRVEPLPLVVTVGSAACFLAGFGLLIAGFAGAHTMWYAAIVLGAATVWWAGAVLSRIVTARAEGLLAVCIALAVVAFVAAVAFAVSMLVRWEGGFSAWIPQLHAALMVCGFATVLIVSFSLRFVPMFALSHQRAGKLSLTIPTVAVFAVPIGLGIFTRPALIAILVVMLLQGLLHARTIRARLRRKLDASLIYGSVGWCLGFLALADAIVSGGPTVSSVALAVLGWISLNIFGYAMKILGFLSWQVARERDSRSLLPLSAAIPEPVAFVALALLTCGAVATAVSLRLAPQFLFAATALYLAGSLAYVAVFYRIGSRYLLGSPRAGPRYELPF